MGAFAMSAPPPGRFCSPVSFRNPTLAMFSKADSSRNSSVTHPLCDHMIGLNRTFLPAFMHLRTGQSARHLFCSGLVRVHAPCFRQDGLPSMWARDGCCRQDSESTYVAQAQIGGEVKAAGAQLPDQPRKIPNTCGTQRLADEVEIDKQSNACHRRQYE